ncbi:MAG: thiamine ABC transporter substrate-binding protein [Leucobacter sp.]
MTYTRNISRPRFIALAVCALPLAAALAVSGCAQGGGGGETATQSETVTIVVHDSFVDSEAFSKAASAATGYDVEVMTAGDGGELTNKLVLTQGAPIADAFFGVDNTFASRLIDGDVVDPVAIDALPARAATLATEIDPNEAAGGVVPLVPIDMGATCVNIDSAWFAEQGVTEPETFDDLADEKYRDLTVLLDPTASSTGASFMIATVAAFSEDGFADYWQRLDENGARIVQGWSDAYYGEFTGASDTGTRPIVVSYSTSPAFTVNEDGSASTTRALLDTCSNQVEFAGVLKGASNPAGAQAVIEYMLSSEFQETIPDEMFMYPVDESTPLPEAWNEFAPLPTAEQAHDLSSAEVQAGLQGWLRTLGDTVGL